MWDPSTDSSVVGHNVYYGGASGNYTNELSVGNATNVVISSLIEGRTYYFAVTAYDDLGDESDYSREITYIVPGVLAMSSRSNETDPLRITFPVAAGHQYNLQFSEDLRSWSTLWQIAGVSNTWVEFDDPETNVPQRFYRLLLQ